jgi:hypothetical protein
MERDQRAAGLVRRDPDRLVALPPLCQHFLGKPREQIGGQRHFSSVKA